MQDTFVQVMAHRDRLTADAPSSLLWQVATRVCLNRLRAERRQARHVGEPAGTGDGALLHAIALLPDESERQGARAVLARLFGAEPTSTRLIATLHYVDGLTLEETAAEVGLSVSGVRKRLRGLRERLGALLPEGAA